MITGSHWLIYTTDPNADRAFFRDVLDWPSVDVGGGWLIFKMPPAELACHPAEQTRTQHHSGDNLLGCVLYLMCDDLNATMAMLEARNVPCTSLGEAPWGRYCHVGLPSGGKIGLYQPVHRTAIDV